MAERIVSIGECMVELAPAGDGQFRAGLCRRHAEHRLVSAPAAAGRLAGRLSHRHRHRCDLDPHAGLLRCRRHRHRPCRPAARPHRRALPDRAQPRRAQLCLLALGLGGAAPRRRSRPARRRARRGAARLSLRHHPRHPLPRSRRAALLAALVRARAAGTRVVFDPNLRPRLWPGREAMCEAVMAAAARADIVLPSFDDEAAAFGDADARGHRPPLCRGSARRWWW